MKQRSFASVGLSGLDFATNGRTTRKAKFLIEMNALVDLPRFNGKPWRMASTGKHWPAIGIAQQHETPILKHNLRMQQRAKLTNPSDISHHVFAEVVQFNGVYPPRWKLCASARLLARWMNAER